MSGKIYIAIRNSNLQYDGRRVVVKRDRTTVREGHPLLVKYPSLFKVLEVDYEVAEKPPEPAPAPTPPPAPVPAPPPAPPAMQVEEATADPERPRRRGRPPMPRDEFGNIIRSDSEEEEGS